MGNTQTWEQTVSQKRLLRDQALNPYLIDDINQRPPRVQDVENRSRLDHDPIVQEITDVDSITILLDHLRQGKFTAEQVALAYIRRYEYRSKKITKDPLTFL